MHIENVMAMFRKGRGRKGSTSSTYSQSLGNVDTNELVDLDAILDALTVTMSQQTMVPSDALMSFRRIAESDELNWPE